MLSASFSSSDTARSLGTITSASGGSTLKRSWSVALQTYASIMEFEHVHLKPNKEIEKIRATIAKQPPHVSVQNPETYFYDYGAVSAKPMSVFTHLKLHPEIETREETEKVRKSRKEQNMARKTKNAQLKLRKASSREFTPFHVLEPILLSNRPEKVRVNPLHYKYKELRNCEMYGSTAAFNTLQRPHSSKRTTKVFHDIADAERFAQGENRTKEHKDRPCDETLRAKTTALLRAIRDRCHRDKVRPKDLFHPFLHETRSADINASHGSGSLTLEQFLYALEKKKIVPPDVIDLPTLFKIFLHLIPNFSGTVSIPVMRKLLDSKDLGPLPLRTSASRSSGVRTRPTSSSGYLSTGRAKGRIRNAEGGILEYAALSVTPPTTASGTRNNSANPSSRPRSGIGAPASSRRSSRPRGSYASSFDMSVARGASAVESAAGLLCFA
eukprot:GEMP01028530.1.p1 GENE.GEMP01028530.1~~GEMP01028530.1.p1  ORF type:complete len:441 (+),score=75.55 GEMP01028530.1:296-1618(+)